MAINGPQGISTRQRTPRRSCRSCPCVRQSAT